MLSEQITVTTTKTSILALIAAKRGVAVGAIASDCQGIMFRYGKLETAVVSISDPASHLNPGSTAGAVILDAVGEDLLGTSFQQFNLAQALISCDTGTVVVHVIVTQKQ